jgi:predicted AlkP superfamily phosphohydrolase/phosphomutase
MSLFSKLVPRHSSLVNRRPKVVVLGLDGVPCSLLLKFADDGTMPNIAKLREEGTLCSMSASIPEVSSTSWSTFMTGVNPGRHAIYGFMEIDKKTYSWKFPNFNDLKSKTIWEIAGEQGKRSIVINIPSTYPAKPFNGMLVSGFVALDLRKASTPDRMYEYLQSMGYRLDVNAARAAQAVDEFTDDIMQTFKKRVEAIYNLYESEDWDMFIAAITETDRLHHYLWSALEDTAHPKHDFFIQFYRELDRFIGAFYEKTDKDTPFMMLSDHGFTTINKEIYLNNFLREKGYLKFTKESPDSFESIDDSSQAFALDPTRIYIHLKDKYRRGCVPAEQYHEIRNAIKDDLVALEVDGVMVIKEVFFKEEIYNGACFEDAPDIVVLSHEGYDLKGSLKMHGLTGRGHLTGCHTRDNALFYINRKISADNLNIVDAGTMALRLLGIDVSGLEGRVLSL